MSAPSESEVRACLSQIRYPGFSRDIVSFGLVKEIRVEGGAVSVQMVLTTADASVPAQIKAASEEAIRGLPGVERATVRIDIHAPAQTTPVSAAAAIEALIGLPPLPWVLSGVG